ncbi:hypothetical protein [Pedobacter sp. GR22-6]|uniref:hypothetical protein n=1 Tax=Pedobacter sp. GR22-6 TaxID=3127957 RepID=UPI00307F90F5
MSKIASASLPSGAKRVGIEQVSVAEKNGFRRPFNVNGSNNIFRLPHMLISFQDYELQNNEKIDLEQIRERLLGEVEEIKSRGTKDEVKLVTVNGTKYMIHKMYYGEDCTTSFISEQKGKNGLKGQLLFKKQNSTEAEKVLNEFLNGIKFFNIND